MSDQLSGRLRAWQPFFAALLVVSGIAPGACAQGPRREGLEPRVPAGKCLSPSGRLLSRAHGERGWRTVAKDATVMSRDLLLVLPGMKATVEPRPHSVTVELRGSLPRGSDFPVWESEVVVHDSRAFDLDFTLRRGRVVLTNDKEKGPARIWVRLSGEDAWQLELPRPGDSVTLAAYGRWPAGVSFSKVPSEEEPTKMVGLLVLAGQAEVKTDRQDYSLSAPPGMAYIQWDSVVATPLGPFTLEKLPAWAKPGAEPVPEARALAAAARRYEERLKSDSPGDVLVQMLAEAGKIRETEQANAVREFTLMSLTALDALVPVVEALADAHSAQARAVAVLALRHWIGSAAGNDLRLYHLLIERLDYRPAQAETVLQLLHSPYAADNPETYELLIAYLMHRSLAVRELAIWHLTRLVPAGRDLGYDPTASEGERQRCFRAWKRLVPDGKLPQRKTEKK